MARTLLRKLDNPPAVDCGGVRIYHGPAKNRPLERLAQLWLYSQIRYAYSLNSYWFTLSVACVNAMAFADSNWVRRISGPEYRRISDEMDRFRKHYPPAHHSLHPRED
jgi:hypothetical protein